VKLRLIFTALAVLVAISAVGLALTSSRTRGVAPANAEARAERAAARPAELAFADRFTGAPLWETPYVTPVQTQTRAIAAPQRPVVQVRTTALDAVRAPAFQLASASATPAGSSEQRMPTVALAYAPSSTPDTDNRTAIYDIAAHTVYMPNGDRLEAHSGLGERQDNPRYVRAKNRGPTPPNTYKLSLRERAFHGVRAIRMTPVDEDKMFGRDGMLAHTYMLRARGHSNGCVVFSNYPAFLSAYLRGEVDRLVVVEHLDVKPDRLLASAAR
jgi:hypothetical protein